MIFKYVCVTFFESVFLDVKMGNKQELSLLIWIFSNISFRNYTVKLVYFFFKFSGSCVHNIWYSKHIQNYSHSFITVLSVLCKLIHVIRFDLRRFSFVLTLYRFIIRILIYKSYSCRLHKHLMYDYLNWWILANTWYDFIIFNNQRKF